ncbi:MAG TPA: twin-arginine translocase subunit TatC [Symbiobacteriaceae bacterium]|jgi:sec-independent protein translocase protein TatC
MDRPAPVFAHLTELRNRIIWSMIAVVVGVAIGWIWVPSLYKVIMARCPVPLTQMGITEVFLVQFHMGIWLGLFIASPFILYQLIAFVLPALQANERRLLFSVLPAVIGLFGVGFSFSYFFIVPKATLFFLGVARDSGANILVSPRDWLDIMLHFSLPLGLVFELPVLIWLLASIGLVSAARLMKWRKYSVVGALVIGALISPAPIVVDQIVMAVPMLLLYEVSIWITVAVEKRRRTRRAAAGL